MAKNIKKKSITLLLRNYFITGVVVLIPIGFTLYLSKILIGLSSKIIPENINPNSYLPYAIPGIEILISLMNDKPLKPGSYRGRKNTSPEKILISNEEKHA